MAMTLRLTDEESSALSRCAKTHDRSMQDVAHQAIREYVGDRIAARQALLDRLVTEDGDALALLAQ